MFAREGDFEIEVLDLSRLASGYGRTIYPRKNPLLRSAPNHMST
jgi:hypothetical protein